MLASPNIRCKRRTLCRKNKIIKPSQVVDSPASGVRHAISTSLTSSPHRTCSCNIHCTSPVADIKVFMTDLRAAFPDLCFGGAADLIAEGDYVVGRWVGGGTHSGPAFSDFLGGSLPVATGRKMHFTGTTVLRLENGKVVEEIGLDDGVTALTQLKGGWAILPLPNQTQKAGGWFIHEDHRYLQLPQSCSLTASVGIRVECPTLPRNQPMGPLGATKLR